MAAAPTPTPVRPPNHAPLAQRPAWRSLLVGWAATAALVPVLAACGKPASEAQCMEIVEKVARLQFRVERKDAPKTEENAFIDQAKEDLRNQAKERCVGRRMPDDAMSCVRKASSPEQIQSECLRFSLLN